MDLLGKLITGLGDDPDGSLRVYVGPRSVGIHTHVDSGPVQKQFRDAWAGTFRGHLTARIPDSSLCDCPEPS